LRAIIFHPKAREAIRRFPGLARAQLGSALFRLQMGEVLQTPGSRPMPSVAKGVAELRVRDEHGAYRAFYYADSEAGVLVFHAFVKKSQRTPPLEIELARKRLKELLDEQT
jgi:phage-related protein